MSTAGSDSGGSNGVVSSASRGCFVYAAALLFFYFCLLWQLLRFGLALFILCLTYDAYAKGWWGVPKSFCNKLNLYFDTKRHTTHTHTPGDTIKHTLAIACCCCCTIVCLAGLRLFAFVNATTQLISTRRVAHRADKGAALLQNLHTYICCCNPTHSHTRTLARTHARTKGDTLQWLHCCSLVAVRKEVGGRAVTTQKSNSNSRSRSRSLWARSVFPLLSLFNSACMSFPFVWFLFLNNYNIQKIILFSLYKFNFVFRAHTHTHAQR